MYMYNMLLNTDYVVSNYNLLSVMSFVGGTGPFVICATVFTLIGKMAITGSFSTIFLYTPELYPTNMR